MSRAFIPAAGHDLLLPLYDPLWHLMGGERVRRSFIRESGLAAGQRILDVGCGTGSLGVQIAETIPDVQVAGLDPDPEALARAARKSEAAGVDVAWHEGYGDELPWPDSSFDRVVSSFMFHHLDRDTKQGLLREVFRVLVPGGEIHLVDFGGQSPGRHGFLARLLHSAEHVEGNLDATLFTGAGFDEVREVATGRSLFGRYAHVVGKRPATRALR